MTLQLVRLLGGFLGFLGAARVDTSVLGVTPGVATYSSSPPPVGALPAGLLRGLRLLGLTCTGEGEPVKARARSKRLCTGVVERLLPVTGVVVRLLSGVPTGLRPRESEARASCSFCVSFFLSFDCTEKGSGAGRQKRGRKEAGRRGHRVELHYHSIAVSNEW